MNRYFITGTDTDCGKTYVTRKLLDSVSNSIAIKPVASGCTLIGGSLVSSDAQQLQLKSPLTLEEINPWRFAAPVSPHIAAREEGVILSVKEIADYCLNFTRAGYDTLFIEGAGGLMVPLNEEETWIDFLKVTRIPVILVVGMKLGCINHALLTESVLKSEGLNCAGWIANCIDSEMDFLVENCCTLKNKLSVPLVSIIGNSGRGSNDGNGNANVHGNDCFRRLL